ncbi:GGDEF domain-containing protein [Caballeronia mineralivorans]|uniref:GGDEF domain-containing protein n=1 Tax=Caballeronia mineralivorans TaxID=2010198 RepID=UPI002AFF1119|nr:GGDEF domain-containing protein [Caballeronia mineralivorans]MEA3096735.1 diguanylate cyclase [Caballeronia mineralivorans]
MNPIEDVVCDAAQVALLRALDGSHMLIAVYDADDRLVFSNSTFNHAFRLDGETRNLTFSDLILHAAIHQCGPRIDRGKALEFIADAQTRRRRQPGQRTFATDLLDGRWFWMTETFFETGWVIVVGSEISELKQNEQALVQARDRAMQEAQTDPLTCLANRRRTLSHLEHAISTSVCSNLPLAVALIDLDRFKSINDCYGHSAGDAVLKDFADASRNVVRRSDLVGRIGGEEFLVVLPGASADDASDVVERLRREVSDRRVRTDAGALVGYSFSAGVCELSAADDSGAALRRADSALYAAKRAGRNCVRVFKRPGALVDNRAGSDGTNARLRRWWPLAWHAVKRLGGRASPMR